MSTQLSTPGTPCATCHGTGLITDVQQWSDGLGMVERYCPACYDPRIRAERAARGVCIYCEGPSAPTAAACCAYHLACCGHCNNGRHARCLRREFGDACACRECWPPDSAAAQRAAAGYPPIHGAREGGTMQSVLTKLHLTPDQLNALYVAPPVNGEVGSIVTANLAARYGLDPLEPLGAQLAALGILTDAEGLWLDDAD